MAQAKVGWKNLKLRRAEIRNEPVSNLSSVTKRKCEE